MMISGEEEILEENQEEIGEKVSENTENRGAELDSATGNCF